MTNGNTYSNSYNQTGPPLTTTGDGWDETHKAVYLWPNSAFSNITIQSLVIEGFKGENIYSGGSVITGMVISGSTLTNFNSDGISILANDLQVVNNTISNGSNSAVENASMGAGPLALIRQLYQGNTISNFPREGIVVVGVDNNVGAGSIQITGNSFSTIGQVNPSGTQSAVYIASQGGSLPPANVAITNNTCRDCWSLAELVTSGNTTVSGNTFIVDEYKCFGFMTFMNPMTGVAITGNSGYATATAPAPRSPQCT